MPDMSTIPSPGPNSRDRFSLLARRRLGPEAGPPPPPPSPPIPAPGPVRLKTVEAGPAPTSSVGPVFEVRQDMGPTGLDPSDRLMMVVEVPCPGPSDLIDDTGPGLSEDDEEAIETIMASPPLAHSVWEIVNDTATVGPVGPTPVDAEPEPSALTLGQTATIGFWSGPNGQTLIRQFNGGPALTALGDWLAETFPNLYGGEGPYRLAGKSNSYVAAVVRGIGRGGEGTPIASAVCAIALSIYATNRGLGGVEAAAHGFRVSRLGLGAACCNLGTSGPAFDAQNGGMLPVLHLARVLDRKSPRGVPLGGDPTLARQAHRLFDLLIQFGDINS